ncbi:glutamate-rich protein 6B [Hemicordylus capensis]|uniref:glutamate-rich protein 6B n=1 Tax=Hemicordylus capensis TaxID=884348 RepID=UPI002304B1E3|nr:glutamate-rich protein 6B [Hemicordylus capensis]
MWRSRKSRSRSKEEEIEVAARPVGGWRQRVRALPSLPRAAQPGASSSPCIANMSDGQNPSGSGIIDQSQAEATHSSSESEDPELSKLLLTVENVKKLQEEYPAVKPVHARQSIEAYIKQSNCFLNETENGADGSKEQDLSAEEEFEATLVIPYREDTRDDNVENFEEISSKGRRNSATCYCPSGKKEAHSASSLPLCLWSLMSRERDLQTRSFPSSIPEVQTSTKHDVADLETQTEWSYSDTSVDLSEKARKKLGHSILDGKETFEEESKKMTADKMREDRRRGLEPEEGVSPAEWEANQWSPTEVHSFTDLCLHGCCEFCTSILKALPTAEELDDKPDRVENFICCRTYKEIFQHVIEDLLESSSPESEIDINPHPRLSYLMIQNQTKRMLMEEYITSRIEERGFENYREVLEQYMRFGTCTKVKFKLSDHPPKPKKIVPKKQRPRPEDVLKIDLEFKAEQLKICHPTKAVKRYYADGKIFSLLFPDGTGQVYYPSGNLAILITYVKDVQFTYIILNDSTHHEVQAFFTNQGYAACYHRNGRLRLNLDLSSGSYFNQKGIGQKLWNWWDTSSHVHAPPFQPIYFQLNTYIQVKIEAQDQIFLTFTKLHDCLQLNVGARLKLQDENLLQFLKPLKKWGQQVSYSKILQIRRLLASLHKLLKILCSTSFEQTPDLSRIISDMYDFMQWKMTAHSTLRQQ